MDRHGREYFSLETAPDGEPFIRSFDEVLMLPLDAEGAVLFAVEPSPAFGEEVLILPGGTVEPGESVEETANRELQEELGVKAGRVEYLGEIWPWSKYLTVRTHICLGRELAPSRLPGDERYPIGAERIPWDDVDSLLTSGRLHDARAIAALYLARRSPHFRE